jgi:DnaJ-domain-containing protein 1
MSSEFAIHKLRAGLLAIFGLAMLAAATAVPARNLAFVVGVVGVYCAGRGLTRLIRIQAVEQNMEWVRAYNEFRHASLPRRVFLLLLAVAEIDGAAADEEREMVRRFVLERFTDPLTTTDLLASEPRHVAADQIGTLASALRRMLSPAERETIFHWACQITFADRVFKPQEQAALQAVARGLGIRAQHARIIFHHAKARFLNRDEASGPRPDPARARPWVSSERQRALATLGLDETADVNQIRRRHRELAKRYHPDAHTHLGPIAAEEASKRFREIQTAYELLVARSG